MAINYYSGDSSLRVSEKDRQQIIDAFLNDLGSKVYAGARKWSEVQRQYWNNPSPFTAAQVEMMLGTLVKQYSRPTMVPAVRNMLNRSQAAVTGAEAIHAARAAGRGHPRAERAIHARAVRGEPACSQAARPAAETHLHRRRTRQVQNLPHANRRHTRGDRQMRTVRTVDFEVMHA